MEFTPRKPVSNPSRSNRGALRHSPYATPGKEYLNRFHQKKQSDASTGSGSAGRRFFRFSRLESQKTQRDVNKSLHKSPIHCNKDSQRSLVESRNEGKGPKWVSAPVKQPSFTRNPSGSPVQSPSLKTYNKPTPSVRSFNQQLPSVKTQNKPPLYEVRRLPMTNPVSSEKGSGNYASASDSDDEIFLNSREENGSYLNNKENKVLKTSSFVSEDPDKENSPSPVKRQRVYANKRKPLSVVKSRLLCDVSAEKIERAYNTKVVPNTNEAIFVPVPVEKEKIVPHRIGFPNYGNTCYINSVMQSLFGLPPFVEDFKRCATKLRLSDSSLFMGLSCLLNSRSRVKIDGVTSALRKVKQNLEKVDDSFQGFKMQDANEFLTLVLDTIKEEINRCHSISSVPSTSSCTSSTSSLDQSLSAAMKEESMSNTTGVKRNIDKNRKEGDAMQGGQVPSALLSLPPSEECENSAGNKKDGETSSFADAQSHSKKNVSNLVNENFEFELLESYRCLGCGEVEGKKQKNYGLYVNLPKDSTQSLQDALGSYMSADERDFHCSKCGHKKFTVLTTFTRIPRILIVQLNRYKYSPTQGESLKVSSRVHINKWLCLDAAVLEDTSPPEPWNTVPASSAGKATKSSASVVRRLSSELNISVTPSSLSKSDAKEKVSPAVRTETTEDDDTIQNAQVNSAAEKNENNDASSLSREDEELEEVMRRSLEDFGGKSEEDEIQQAIRLSLQDQGMTYAMDNQEQGEQTQGEDMVDDNAVSMSNGNAGDHTYQLASIISHFGLTTNVGHYVSDVYNFKEKRWFHYDDDKVGEVNTHTVYGEGRQKNAYIFFYMHRDICQQAAECSTSEAS